MCKIYQVEYKCRHLRKEDTAHCNEYKTKLIPHQITIHPQYAPHKCPPCRHYDRDRWRRGWPPLPIPPPYQAPARLTVPDEPDSDGDDFAVEFEEGTDMGAIIERIERRFIDTEQVEHDEGSGGAGLAAGDLWGEGFKLDGDGHSAAFGARARAASLSVTTAFPAFKDEKETEKRSPSSPTTPTKASFAASIKARMQAARIQASRKRAESFAGFGGGSSSTDSGDDKLRSRFGGYGGMKLRARRGSVIGPDPEAELPVAGGESMERAVSRRPSVSSIMMGPAPMGGVAMARTPSRRGSMSSTGEGLPRPMGGLPMERTASRRGSMSSTGEILPLPPSMAMGGVPMQRTPSRRGASYRGADMERGGVGLGFGLALRSTSSPTVIKTGSPESKGKGKEIEGGGMSAGVGLGLGLGFGGAELERDEEPVAPVIDATSPQPSRARSRRGSVSSVIFNPVDEDGTSDDTMESVTAQFLDF